MRCFYLIHGKIQDPNLATHLSVPGTFSGDFRWRHNPRPLIESWYGWYPGRGIPESLRLLGLLSVGRRYDNILNLRTFRGSSYEPWIIRDINDINYTTLVMTVPPFLFPDTPVSLSVGD